MLLIIILFLLSVEETLRKKADSKLGREVSLQETKYTSAYF